MFVTYEKRIKHGYTVTHIYNYEYNGSEIDTKTIINVLGIISIAINIYTLIGYLYVESSSILSYQWY